MKKMWSVSCALLSRAFKDTVFLVLGFRVFVVCIFFEIVQYSLWRFFSFICALQNSFKSEAVALRPFLGVFVDAFRATRARAVILLIYFYFYFYF